MQTSTNESPGHMQTVTLVIRSGIRRVLHQPTSQQRSTLNSSPVEEFSADRLMGIEIKILNAGSLLLIYTAITTTTHVHN